MTTAAYITSLPPSQSYSDHWPSAASARLREIETTQPNQLATRIHLRTATALTVYVPSLDSTKFDQYYNERLYAYLKAQEQALAEKNGKHGNFPVCLARIGKPVFILSPLVFEAAEWPTAPMLKEVFESIIDVKQFSGEWTLEGGYSANSAVPSYSVAPNEGISPSHLAPSYSIRIGLETPCNVTFYQFNTAQTIDFDRAVEQIAQEWPDVAKEGIISSLGAARVADVFFVVTDEADTERLDAEVEEALSQYFNPVIAELLPYPRKSRF